MDDRSIEPGNERECSRSGPRTGVPVEGADGSGQRSEPLIDEDDRVELARCRARPRDSRARLWLFASFVAHAVVIGLFWLTPPTSAALTLDITDADARYIRVSFTPPRQPFESPSARSEVGIASGAALEGASSPEEALVRVRHRSAPIAERSDEERARDSLDVLRAVLGSQRASVPSPFADVEGFGADGLGALLADVGPGLGMQGAGRGTGRGPNDTVVLGDAFGLGARGATCSEEFERPSGVIVRASCNGGPLSGAIRGIGTGVARSQVRESHRPRVCGGGPPGGCVAEVQGSLTREQVRRVVARQRAQIGFCYEQALASRPDLGGRVTARWVVAPDGHVTVSSIDTARTDLRSPQVEQCVAAAVRRWTFPESEGVTAVSYPFVLETSD